MTLFLIVAFICIFSFVNLISPPSPPGKSSQWMWWIWNLIWPKPEVHFTVAVEDLPPVQLSSNACQKLVGATDTVKWILLHIDHTISMETDNSYRKTIILISRCPRGGKTTILEMLHMSLQFKHMHVMTVSFNGVSGFVRLMDETPTESLFRLITNQLDMTIDKQSPRVTDWKSLDVYIGDEPFVLLIDELNVTV